MSARIYVGTYYKYNRGNIAGRWFDLEDYASKDEFLAAANALHNDEEDPELMFQDWEGIPDGWVSECDVDEKLWAWLGLDESDRTLLNLYSDYCGDQVTIEEARAAFLGQYASPEDWAEDFLEESGVLDRIPEQVRSHINFKTYARDSGLLFIEHGGQVWVFHNE